MGEPLGPAAAFGRGWIFEENLRPFYASVAEFSDYGFDDSDWQAIENALPGTDVEKPDGTSTRRLAGCR
jgi:hypothetical protein